MRITGRRKLITDGPAGREPAEPKTPQAVQYAHLFRLSRRARKLAQALGPFTLEIRLSAKGYTTSSQPLAFVVYPPGGQRRLSTVARSGRPASNLPAHLVARSWAALIDAPEHDRLDNRDDVQGLLKIF